MTLAVFSGTPRFAEPLHVGGPIVEPETRERFRRLSDEAFDSNYLTNDGPLCRRLEEEIAARHGVRHAVLMNNATVAQLVLLKAMDLGKGEAVIGADTFISTPHMCEWVGLRPVFADVDPVTLSLDPADLARRVTPETKAVIPTHVFGVMADLPAIKKAAGGIPVVVDAAHAFDCDRGGIGPGNSGVPEFMSFHATKFFSTLEGGAVFTHDADLARALREIRNFGFSGNAEVIGTGTNAKVSEISAAFGLASLPALEERRRRLGEVHDVYVEALAGVPGLRVHPLDALGRNNHRYFALFIEEGFGARRNAVHQAMRRENVLTRLYFHPGCHRTEYYRRRDGVPPSLPVVDNALEKILCLPTSFDRLPHRETALRVAELLRDIHRHAAEIDAWWDKEKEKA